MNFTHCRYDTKIHLVDEWAALMAKIDRTIAYSSELMNTSSSARPRGRQAGVFIIFAMQRLRR